MEKQDIEIAAADGTIKARLFLPGGAQAPQAGVILYMDAFGPRASLNAIAERLCTEGYAVLVPDLFYRFGAYGPFDAKTAFQVEETAAKIRGMISGTTQEMSIRDTAAFVDTLKAHGVSRIGTVGYCMGGARALNAAAAYPDLIAAAASFHGGNLAADAPDSPHLRAADLKARIYIGMAGIDRSFPPEQSTRLAEALRSAQVDFVMENYVGMQHGWAVPDHNVYDPAGAERHFRRLFSLFAETIAAEA